MSASTENLIRAVQTNDAVAFYGWLQSCMPTCSRQTATKQAGMRPWLQRFWTREPIPWCGSGSGSSLRGTTLESWNSAV